MTSLLGSKLQSLVPLIRTLRICSTTCKTNLEKATSTGGFLITTRNTSFFNKVTAAELWKGITSVSNAGRKRGRGKGVGKRTAKDLNRGQVIGVGQANIVWPGLTAPVIRGKELVEQVQLPPDTEREAKLLKMRDSMGVFRPLTLSPLERGWSGTRMQGRSVGPPDPIGQDTFEGFDTKILEMKTVTTMDGHLGRKKRFSVLAFTGNKAGLGGFAVGKSPEGRAAIRRAKNKAGQKLIYIDRYNDHTVLHDFFCRFGETKIFVYKKPEGFGLVCHRAIRAMCELIGIRDVYAKIEGSAKNVQHVTKAFMLGLLQQKPYQKLAEEKQLYLVEQREENGNLPVIIAEPSRCRTEKEIPTTEPLDFTQVALDDRIALRRKKYVPFFTKLEGWETHLNRSEYRRNHPQVVLQMAAEYGYGKSHLTKQFPECDKGYGWKLREKKLAQQEASDD